MIGDAYVAAVFYFPQSARDLGTLFLELSIAMAEGCGTGRLVSFACAAKSGKKATDYARGLPKAFESGRRMSVQSPELAVVRGDIAGSVSLRAAVDVPGRPKGPNDARWCVGCKTHGFGDWMEDAALTTCYIGWRRELVDTGASDGGPTELHDRFPALLRAVVTAVSKYRPYYGFVDHQLFEDTEGLSVYGGIRWHNMGRELLFDHDRWVAAGRDRQTRVPRLFWGNYFGPQLLRKLGGAAQLKRAMKDSLRQGDEDSVRKSADWIWPMPDGSHFVAMTPDVRDLPPDVWLWEPYFVRMKSWRSFLVKKSVLV
ncbi:MAG TPA: hypothetical protein VFF65_07970 [Phycisphaerales bacterium]|nr:hypothetical protein [Phycisphaerales bacterium]